MSLTMQKFKKFNGSQEFPSDYVIKVDYVIAVDVITDHLIKEDAYLVAKLTGLSFEEEAVITDHIVDRSDQGSDH